MAGLTVLEIVFAITLYLRGRWTWAFATLNTVLGLAFAIPVLWLMREDRLFNPDLVAAANALADGDWFGYTMGITALVIAIVIAIDIADGFRKAWRSSRQATADA